MIGYSLSKNYLYVLLKLFSIMNLATAKIKSPNLQCCIDQSSLPEGGQTNTHFFQDSPPPKKKYFCLSQYYYKKVIINNLAEQKVVCEHSYLCGAKSNFWEQKLAFICYIVRFFCIFCQHFRPTEQTWLTAQDWSSFLEII